MKKLRYRGQVAVEYGGSSQSTRLWGECVSVISLACTDRGESVREEVFQQFSGYLLCPAGIVLRQCGSGYISGGNEKVG